MQHNIQFKEKSKPCPVGSMLPRQALQEHELKKG
jgi:hypothetical protein